MITSIASLLEIVQLPINIHDNLVCTNGLNEQLMLGDHYGYYAQSSRYQIVDTTSGQQPLRYWERRAVNFVLILN